MPLHPRKRKFLEELPKHKNKVMPAAIAAGYSPEYARANGRNIYKSAIKGQAKEIAEMVDSGRIKPSEAKRLMSEIVGLTPEMIFERIRNIATQEKDYSSALKVLGPLVRELGVELDSEAPKVTVPVLNVSVKGSVKPQELLPTTNIVGNMDDAGETGPSGGPVAPGVSPSLS